MILNKIFYPKNAYVVGAVESVNAFDWTNCIVSEFVGLFLGLPIYYFFAIFGDFYL